MERSSSAAALSDRTRLYVILGVARDATEAEIKKAYKRTALKTHPDKPGGSQEKFQEAQRAHEILIDKDKRKIYDRFGEKGLSMQDGAGSILPKELLESSRLMCLCCTVMLLFGLLFLFIALRFENSIEWSWTAVWSPMWIISSVLGLIVLMKQCQRDNSGQAWLIHMFTIGYFILLLFQILFVLKADGVLTVSWAVVFIPVIPLELIWIVVIIKSFIDNRAAEGLCSTLRTFVVQMMTLVFFVLRMDGTIEWNWSLVFLPFYGSKILFWCFDYFSGCVTMRNLDPETKKERKAILQASGCCVCYISLFFGLLIGWLDDGTVAPVVVFLPIYLLIFCICCVCYCGCWSACWSLLCVNTLYEEPVDSADETHEIPKGKKETEPMKEAEAPQQSTAPDHVLNVTDDADEMD